MSVSFCARRGTMDVSTTKLLSIHISALLPPTSTELDVPHIVKVAAILGIGLVYQSTTHRHIAEVLLSEIGQLAVFIYRASDIIAQLLIIRQLLTIVFLIQANALQ